MSRIRNLGNNVRFLLHGDEQTFCRTLGFSLDDLHRLEEGRLLLTFFDAKEVADYFGVPLSSLYQYYPERSDVHVVGDAGEEDIDKILDVFDIYCDLKAAVARVKSL